MRTADGSPRACTDGPGLLFAAPTSRQPVLKREPAFLDLRGLVALVGRRERQDSPLLRPANTRLSISSFAPGLCQRSEPRGGPVGYWPRLQHCAGRWASPLGDAVRPCASAPPISSRRVFAGAASSAFSSPACGLYRGMVPQLLRCLHLKFRSWHSPAEIWVCRKNGAARYSLTAVFRDAFSVRGVSFERSRRCGRDAQCRAFRGGDTHGRSSAARFRG